MSISSTTLIDTPAEALFVAEADGITEYRLISNGMKVLLVENRIAPVATFLVVYKVGSRNEAVGHTGATHLLEHMMFKGTPAFNSAAGTQIAATLQRIGASFNATTWYDRTNYFETVAADQLELAIRLEADRMRNSLIADSDRQSEMTVVRNELDRGQNEPANVLDESVYATAFIAHPYHHPTIGWRSDVEGVSTERLKEFYHTFYHPNNATAVLVGDFDRNHALELILKYFGIYPSSDRLIPEVYTEEPMQQGERRVTIRRAGDLPLVQISFRTPAALGQMNVLSASELALRSANPPVENDIYPLEVLSTALTGGITSRLYQALVEKQLAASINSNVDQHRDPGLFSIYATVMPDAEPEKVEHKILKELKKIAKTGLTRPALSRAKQQILAHVAFSREGTAHIAMQISEYEAVADWRYFTAYPANIERVTSADIKRVISKYLIDDNRTVGHFIPKVLVTDAAPIDTVSPSGPQALKSLALDNQLGYHRWHRQHGRRGIQFYRKPVWSTENLIGSNSAATSVSGSSGSSIASRVDVFTLNNGATLLVLENKATPTMRIRGSLRAGTFFAPEGTMGKWSLAQICASMLERGSNTYTKLEIAERLESVGAELDFASSTFAVSFNGRARRKDFSSLIWTLADELRNPSFPDAELKKLKQQVISSIQEQQSNTHYRAYERLSQLLYERSNPFYVPPGNELIDSLNSVTVDDIRTFHARQYGCRSLILVVVGDVNTNHVRENFARLFSDFELQGSIDVNIPDQAPSTSKNEIIKIKDKASVDLLMGTTTTLRRDSSDFYAAMLANNALGESTLSSRLGLQVRDKEGLTYGIGSRFRSPGLAPGPWYIAVSVNPQNVDRAIESATNVLKTYVTDGITAKELANEKSSAIGSYKVSLSTNAGIAEAIWNAQYYQLGLEYLDQYSSLIDAVTLEDARSAARKHFRSESLATVIAGDV